MAKAQAVASKIVQDSGLVHNRAETDTLKIWESYREQAALWRSLTMLQFPTTLLLVLLCLVMWYNKDITLHVPAKPLPGIYAAHEIPDTEFINVATDLLGLTATYRPHMARAQFMKAQDQLTEPFLSKFKREIVDVDLRAIEQTSRTQVFYADPIKTSVDRSVRGEVRVSVEGDRVKYIAGNERPTEHVRFSITMMMLPKNPLNPYGIVIKDMSTEDLDPHRS